METTNYGAAAEPTGGGGGLELAEWGLMRTGKKQTGRLALVREVAELHAGQVKKQ